MLPWTAWLLGSGVVLAACQLWGLVQQDFKQRFLNASPQYVVPVTAALDVVRKDLQQLGGGFLPLLQEVAPPVANLPTGLRHPFLRLGIGHYLLTGIPQKWQRAHYQPRFGVLEQRGTAWQEAQGRLFRPKDWIVVLGRNPHLEWKAEFFVVESLETREDKQAYSPLNRYHLKALTPAAGEALIQSDALEVETFLFSQMEYKLESGCLLRQDRLNGGEYGRKKYPSERLLCGVKRFEIESRPVHKPFVFQIYTIHLDWHPDPGVPPRHFSKMVLSV